MKISYILLIVMMSFVFEEGSCVLTAIRNIVMTITNPLGAVSDILTMKLNLATKFLGLISGYQDYKMQKYKFIAQSHSKQMSGLDINMQIKNQNHEKKKPTLNDFRLIHRMNISECVCSLVCQIASDPLQFGEYGARVNKYFSDMKEAGMLRQDEIIPYNYMLANDLGKRNGIKACHYFYSDCALDMKDAINFIPISNHMW